MTMTLERKRGVPAYPRQKKNKIEIAGTAFDWPRDGLRLKHDDPARASARTKPINGGCLWLGASEGALGVSLELCDWEWDGTMGPVPARRSRVRGTCFSLIFLFCTESVT